MEQSTRKHLFIFLLIPLILSVSVSCGGGGSSSGANSSFIGGGGTGEAMLSWTPPITNTDGSPVDLAGFRIYAGLASNNLQPALFVSAIDTTAIIGGLALDTYYFAVAAISVSGAESTFSNVQSKTIF